MCSTDGLKEDILLYFVRPRCPYRSTMTTCRYFGQYTCVVKNRVREKRGGRGRGGVYGTPKLRQVNVTLLDKKFSILTKIQLKKESLVIPTRLRMTKVIINVYISKGKIIG